MSILSIDPGTTCGVTLWTNEGEHRFTKEMHIDDLRVLLAFVPHRIPDELIDISVSMVEDPVKVVVAEDFRLRRNKAVQQTGSRMDASRALGYAELFAEQAGAAVVVQQPDILRIAAMHAGVKVPGKSHIKDGVSSYLHGFYYLEKQGLRRPTPEGNTDLVS
jgi:hypothetical protein